MVMVKTKTPLPMGYTCLPIIKKTYHARNLQPEKGRVFYKQKIAFPEPFLLLKREPM